MAKTAPQDTFGTMNGTVRASGDGSKAVMPKIPKMRPQGRKIGRDITAGRKSPR